MGKMSFTEEQIAVIGHEEGHACVSAVPGAGKSTVLRARLMRLNELYSANRLLAVMFNKAAQVEFLAKLRTEAGPGVLPQVRTLHSIGFGIDKRLVQRGLLPAAKLESSEMAMQLAAKHALRNAMASDGKRGSVSKEDLDEFMRFMTLVKSTLDPPDIVLKRANLAQKASVFPAALARLEEKKASEGILYFDDLIYRPMQHLSVHPQDWEGIANWFDQILVDEMQDVSPIQFALLKGIAGRRASVMAVGDPNQSIYGFRGSSVKLMTEAFRAEFAPATEYPMSQTFRFGARLALCANHLITHNQERNRSLVKPAKGTPDTEVATHAHGANEPTGILEAIEQKWVAGKLHEAALLVRNFSHAIPYEIELAEKGVPYFVYGREPLLFVPEIAAMAGVLQLATGHWVIQEEDRGGCLESLLRVPTMYAPRHLLNGLVQEMQSALAQGNTRGIVQVLRRAAQSAGIDNKGLQQALHTRADALEILLSGRLANEPPTVIMGAYIKITDMMEVIKRGAMSGAQGEESKATIEALIAAAARAKSTIDFLDTLGAGATTKKCTPPPNDHLTITTIHRSKGREWPLVLVGGMNSGSFPSERDGVEQEEERRLAYVAATRAKKQLVLFHNSDDRLARHDHDTGEVVRKKTQNGASAFLYEMELGLSNAVADAVQGALAAELDARRADVIHALYGTECNVRIKVSQTAREWAGKTAMPPTFKLKKGQKVWSKEEGGMVVIDPIHPPVYLVQKDDGTREHTVIRGDGYWLASA